MAGFTKQQRAARDERLINEAVQRALQTIPKRRFFFIEDDHGERFRIWHEGEPCDTFDIIPYGEDSHSVKEFVRRLCEARPTVFVYDNGDTD